MGRMAWGVVLLGLALAARAEQSNALEFPATASIEVDANGKAQVLTLSTGHGPKGAPPAVLTELVEARLRERISSWQFVPATRDGLPVPSRTHLSIGLRAMDDGHGGIAVRVVSASTGASLQEHRMGDVIAAIPGPGIYVVADMHYGSDGRVFGVDVTDQRIYSDGRFVPFGDRRFKRALENALKRWTFDPEIVAGQAIEGHGRMPIRVCLSDACMAAPVDEGEAREFAASDPAVTLRDDVAGTTL